jgi:hypothetical protein
MKTVAALLFTFLALVSARRSSHLADQLDQLERKTGTRSSLLIAVFFQWILTHSVVVRFIRLPGYVRWGMPSWGNSEEKSADPMDVKDVRRVNLTRRTAFLKKHTKKKEKPDDAPEPMQYIEEMMDWLD